ncbi:MAG: DUF3301 domain-containing protein [Gammaproteobacteria bacterium]
MQGTDLLWLVGGAALVWFWVDSMRARERAVALCANLCRTHGVQLLDQTVALSNLGFARNPRGRLQLRRRYRFEFTRSGAARDSGTIVMLGSRMETAEMPSDGSRTYESGES